MRNKRGTFFALLLFLLTACRTSKPDVTPPTLMVLPTLVPSATVTPSATATTTASPTATVTPTPTFTATSTPSITPLPTLTATYTLTPTPTPVQIVISSEIGANVRSGPDTVYEVIAEVDTRQTFVALAYTVNASGDVWYLIELAPGSTGWISEWVASRDGEANLSQVALAVTIPPSPTPTLTLTPTMTFTPSPTPTLPPGANARVTDQSQVNLRVGPGQNYARQVLMAPSTPLRVIGRTTDSSWVQVLTFDGQTGWVFADLVSLYQLDAASLPVSWVEPVVSAGPGSGLLSGNVLQNTRQIYQAGRSAGNNPAAFMVIGDSISGGNQQNLPLFCAFARGTYALGSYGTLQATIDFFGQSGSFCANNQTAQSGFATSFILDPIWANPALCSPGETPLACEYRTRKPAIAIIYIGIMDMLTSTPDTYRAHLDTIVRTLVSFGVIPVLTTITTSDTATAAAGNTAKIQAINQIIRSTAANYQVPLIEFQQAAHGLPNQGCQEDGHHLSYRVDGVINFTGDEQIYGKDLRELLTLQMLDEIKRSVSGS